MYMAVHAVYTVCTWPWTAVYTGRKHGRVQGTQPYARLCTLYMTVYGCAPCTRVCLRPVYTVVYGP